MSSISILDRIRWTLKHEGPLALARKCLRALLDPKRLRPKPHYRPESFSLTPDQLEAIERRLGLFEMPPLISVVMPVYNPSLQFLREAVESVQTQSYEEWELCIADDASADPKVREYLLSIRSQDKRIKVFFRQENGHISRASNSALELVSGEFVGLLDHDDVLAEHALLLVADRVSRYPNADIVYSNEDKIDTDGNHSEPTFKPKWSPEYFLSFMYIGHLTVYRTSLVRELGGFRTGYEGSQDYDLALRVSEIAREIHHIPEILYHWRMHGDSVAGNIKAKPYAFTAAKKALASALERRGQQGSEVLDTKQPGIYRVNFALEHTPTVGVVLDLRHDSSVATLERIVSSVDYPCVEWLIRLDREKLNAAELSSLQAYIEEIGKSHSVRFLAMKDTYPLNLPPERGGESPDYLVSLSSEIVPLHSGWISEMLVHATRPRVGLVGGLLVTPAGDHVHAGYVLTDRVMYHHMYGTHHAEAGYGARLTTVNNVSAVTSRAMMMNSKMLYSSQAFLSSWSSDESFALAFALELIRGGMRHVFTPHARFAREGDAFPKYVVLDSSKSDFATLCKRFGLLEFDEEYYPQGLHKNPPNYTWDLPLILGREHLELDPEEANREKAA